MAISLFDTAIRTKKIKRGKQSLLLPNTLYRVTGYSDISFLESFYSVIEFIRPSQNFINVHGFIFLEHQFLLMGCIIFRKIQVLCLTETKIFP